MACAACSSPAVPTPSPASPAVRLNAALGERSRGDFLAVFAPYADDQAVGLSWFTVLDAGAATIRDAGPGRLTASYRLSGDRAQATQQVAYEFAAGTDRIGWVGVVDGVLPLWSLGGVTLTSAADGTLLSASLDARQRTGWTTRLDHADVTVRAASVGEDWSGGLVVEIPPQGRFEEVSGASATSASAITVCAAGTPRVIVNPAVLSQSDAWLDSTLVHEAVHVATNSACAPPGTSLDWVVEGLAESVAAHADPDTAARNHGLVITYLKEHGVPDSLPQTPQTLTDYALAQLAVDQVRAHLGAKVPDFWRRAIHDATSVTPAEVSRATAWYVAALKKLAG